MYTIKFYSMYYIRLFLLSILFVIERVDCFDEPETIDWEKIEDTGTVDDVKYFLYTREVKAEMYNEQSGFQHFEPHKPTRVLIHGFADSTSTSLALPLLRTAFLKVCDCNVIEVDWSKYAVEPYYLEASMSTLRVGRNVGEFLIRLGANLNTTELIAFSLGCHVAGKAGATTSSSVHKIIALDPALPLFSNSPASHRLDASDARIVEALHTAGGTLGFAQPLGLRDFYANGGVHPQPGCGHFDLVCSHRRAFRYYAEALVSYGRGFKARLCTSYTDYEQGRCKGKPFLSLANHNTDMNFKGSFYFDTNSGNPYGRYRNKTG